MQVEMVVLDDRLKELEYATPGSAGVDLRACNIAGSQIGEDINGVTIYPGQTVKIGAGLAVHIGSITDEGIVDESVGLVGKIYPRSGLATKHGIVLANVVGIVDQDYQGEIIIAIRNDGQDQFLVEPMMRIAQMLIEPVLRPSYVRVSEFTDKTERGAGGFGSSGVA